MALKQAGPYALPRDFASRAGLCECPRAPWTGGKSVCLIVAGIFRRRPGPRAHPSAREAGAVPYQDRLMVYDLAAPTPVPFERTARVNVSRMPAHGQGVTSISLLKCLKTKEREGELRVRIPLSPPL